MQSQRIKKDGSLTVTVGSLLSANKLPEMTSVAGIEVVTSVPQPYSKNIGNIKGVPFEYTDSQLLECLQENTVTSVPRQIAYTPQPNGNIQANVLDSVIL